jgi:hypothetical protein
MVGIVVDHDIVIVPKPVAAIVIVIWRDLKEKAANIEPVSTAAAQPPNVPRAKAGGEMPVLPRMVKMIVGIVAAGIMSYPAIIFSMDVGSLWVAFLIAEAGMPFFLLRRTSGLPRATIGSLFAGGSGASVCRSARRTASRNVSIADSVFASAALSALGRLIAPLWLLTMLLSPCLGKSATGKCRTEYKNSNEFFHALFLQ